MGLIKAKPQEAAKGLLKGVLKRMRPRPAPLPNFNIKRLPYTEDPKRKTIKKPLYIPPLPVDPNMRVPVEEMKPEFKLTGANKMPKRESLEYNQPAWLTKALKENPEAKKDSSFRQIVTDWFKGKKSSMKKSSMKIYLKDRPGLVSGRRNQDSQLNKMTER